MAQKQRNSVRRLLRCTMALSLICASGCFRNSTPGPDRQFEGLATGAVVGAGTGAVTGFHVAAATGPGAAIGAGFGAVAGAIQGAVKDSQEDRIGALARETEALRDRSLVQQTLQDQFQKRMELHPNRDIYPADLFFVGDETRLCSSGAALVAEIAKLNVNRLAWSKLTIAVYIKSKDENSEYARHLAEERAKSLGDQLERNGINPRRIETRPMIVSAPVLIDPLDDPERYNQAVELILADK